jgi:hypothetical protein
MIQVAELLEVNQESFDPVENPNAAPQEPGTCKMIATKYIATTQTTFE